MTPQRGAAPTAFPPKKIAQKIEKSTKKNNYLGGGKSLLANLTVQRAAPIESWSPT